MNELNLSRNDIKEVQSILNRMEYGPLVVDGIWGPATSNAIRNFQARSGLPATGNLDTRTYQLLETYMNGYDIYTIRPGDTYISIARKFGISPEYLEQINGIAPESLIPGETLVIPFSLGIVPTDIGYTYKVLMRNLRSLKTLYPFIDIGVAGKSSLGRNIYYIKIGIGDRVVHYNAAHHGLEWITSPLLMKYAENFLDALVRGSEFNEFSPETIYNDTTMYIVPMVNPDGVDLVINGLQPGNPNYNDLIRWNNGSSDFSRTWQANNNGVDINHNYNALWEEYKALAAEAGYDRPGPTRYPGPSAESEPETKAMVSFTGRINPRIALAYHTQGEVIYWQFNNIEVPGARMIGEEFARVSGYALDETTGLSSYSGYKDWVIQDFRVPAYTIEAGKGTNPLPISQFDKIYSDNIGILLSATHV